ncbi:MAG: periplasmic heavy metal sensor [Pirellulales bacterium]|nr:periplasmic heavy metal sensor [Pirellulales bacterium]
MGKHAKLLLLILSVALNVAFVGVWLVHLAAARTDYDQDRCTPGDGSSIWCPLHRELNVTPEQWSRIEPLLRAFRTEADEICRQMTDLRSEIIDLLATPDTDMAAVKAAQEDVLAGQRKIQELVISQLTAEKEILTPRQQSRLFEMLRNRTGCDRHGPLLVPGRGVEGGVGQTLRTGGGEQ